LLLELTKNESKAFYDTISSELHCVINEYDPDTRRPPSKKRIKDGEYGKNIMYNWEKTQPQIAGTNFINLDEIVACNIPLLGKEVEYTKSLLEKHIKECRKELMSITPPFLCVYAQINNYIEEAEHILEKLV